MKRQPMKLYTTIAPRWHDTWAGCIERCSLVQQDRNPEGDESQQRAARVASRILGTLVADPLWEVDSKTPVRLLGDLHRWEIIGDGSDEAMIAWVTHGRGAR